MPAAGFDPAYIPGITAPRPEEPKEAESPLKDAVPDEAADVEQPAEDERAESADAAEEDTGEAAEDEAGAEAKAEDGDEEEAGGPAFEASDHRGSIAAGRRGVTFQLDGETADFDWDEIGAVEIDTPRFGRRFSVTVYTTARRWYSADVVASARSVLKKWTAELDEVLDAYFEDAKPEDAEPEDAGSEEAKSEEAKSEEVKSQEVKSDDTEPEDATSEDATS